jgi:hypothetical protein
LAPVHPISPSHAERLLASARPLDQPVSEYLRSITHRLPLHPSVTAAVLQKRPYGTRCFVGERDGNNIRRSTIAQPSQPRP